MAHMLEVQVGDIGEHLEVVNRWNALEIQTQHFCRQ